MKTLCLLALTGLMLSMAMQALAKPPLFDAHLHYSQRDADVFTPEDILEKFDQSGIEQAIVTSTPPQTVQSLHQAAPERIVPFLGLYRDAADKQSWVYDQSLPARMEEWLEEYDWAGIGEIHIFAINGNLSLIHI